MSESSQQPPAEYEDHQNFDNVAAALSDPENELRSNLARVDRMSRPSGVPLEVPLSVQGASGGEALRNVFLQRIVIDASEMGRGKLRHKVRECLRRANFTEDEIRTVANDVLTDEQRRGQRSVDFDNDDAATAIPFLNSHLIRAQGFFSIDSAEVFLRGGLEKEHRKEGRKATLTLEYTPLYFLSLLKDNPLLFSFSHDAYVDNLKSFLPQSFPETSPDVTDCLELVFVRCKRNADSFLSRRKPRVFRSLNSFVESYPSDPLVKPRVVGVDNLRAVVKKSKYASERYDIVAHSGGEETRYGGLTFPFNCFFCAPTVPPPDDDDDDDDGRKDRRLLLKYPVMGLFNVFRGIALESENEVKAHHKKFHAPLRESSGNAETHPYLFLCKRCEVDAPFRFTCCLPCFQQHALILHAREDRLLTVFKQIRAEFVNDPSRVKMAENLLLIRCLFCSRLFPNKAFKDRHERLCALRAVTGCNYFGTPLEYSRSYESSTAATLRENKDAALVLEQVEKFVKQVMPPKTPEERDLTDEDGGGGDGGGNDDRPPRSFRDLLREHVRSHLLVPADPPSEEERGDDEEEKDKEEKEEEVVVLGGDSGGGSSSASEDDEKKDEEEENEEDEDEEDDEEEDEEEEEDEDWTDKEDDEEEDDEEDEEEDEKEDEEEDEEDEEELRKQREEREREEQRRIKATKRRDKERRRRRLRREEREEREKKEKQQRRRGNKTPAAAATKKAAAAAAKKGKKGGGGGGGGAARKRGREDDGDGGGGSGGGGKRRSPPAPPKNGNRDHGRKSNKKKGKKTLVSPAALGGSFSGGK